MNLIGEYECRLDQKGRVLFPSGLKHQLQNFVEDGFVVNRGFEQCLVLYPKDKWLEITESVNKLNQYVKENREFIRYFYRGALELNLDKAGRILLTKSLLDYASISKEVVFFAYSSKIEIWSKALYNGLMSKEPNDFSALAEKVMGFKLEDNG